MRIISLLLPLALLAAGCSGGDDCVEHDLTGDWKETERSTMTLTQTCEGKVSGQWTVLEQNGTVASDRIVEGDVLGNRFTFLATCVDQSCTYMTLTADGTDGTGMTILDGGERLEGMFSAPGRANGSITFRRE